MSKSLYLHFLPTFTGVTTSPSISCSYDPRITTYRNQCTPSFVTLTECLLPTLHFFRHLHKNHYPAHISCHFIRESIFTFFCFLLKIHLSISSISCSWCVIICVQDPDTNDDSSSYNWFPHHVSLSWQRLILSLHTLLIPTLHTQHNSLLCKFLTCKIMFGLVWHQELPRDFV